MAHSTFRIRTTPPLRDLAGRFAVATNELAEARRPIMREQGRRFKELLQDEAPKGRTGKFARGIQFRTFVKGGGVGFTASVPQPLGKWLIHGTGLYGPKKSKYPITPKGPGYPLKFFWERGPHGPGVYFFMRVMHPGIKPNPFPGRAYRRWLPGARAELRRVALRFVRDIAGAKVGTKGFAA